MAPWLVIPVKSLTGGKSRLAGVLSRAARRRLGTAMLGHVLTIAGNERVLVVSACPLARRLARTHGVSTVADPGRGLDLAVFTGVRAALAQGAGAVVVLASDLPLLSAGELARLCDRRAGVVLCRDRHGNGTNALRLARPLGFRFAYGAGSAAAHLAEARRRRLTVVELALAGVAFDIDTADDLAALIN